MCFRPDSYGLQRTNLDANKGMELPVLSELELQSPRGCRRLHRTRMLSSRMRTTRFSGRLLGAGGQPGEMCVYLPRGVCLGLSATLLLARRPRGRHPPDPDADTAPVNRMTDRQV